LEKYESFPFYGDGLPAATFERMKNENVVCTTHDVTIPLINSELLAEHCKPSCCLDWPLKDMYVISGESHEEIMMSVTALTLSTSFGLLELLSEMGRQTKNAQLQAIRTKRLHTLFEINYIFLKGSMTALIIPYVADCAKTNLKPTVGGLFSYVTNSENMKYQARFRFLCDVNLPCLVKRIAVRLNNKEFQMVPLPCFSL